MLDFSLKQNPKYDTSVDKKQNWIIFNDLCLIQNQHQWLVKWDTCISFSDSFRGKAQIILPEAVQQGSTISYKDLACLCGNSAASRAAGGAMANNPISFLIPCHRVISSHGKVGNYSHGKKNKIKQWLLEFESK